MWNNYFFSETFCYDDYYHISNYWIIFLVCFKLQIHCCGRYFLRISYFHVHQVLECDALLNVKILLEQVLAWISVSFGLFQWISSFTWNVNTSPFNKLIHILYMNRKQSQRELTNWIHNCMDSLLAISDQNLVQYLSLSLLSANCNRNFTKFLLIYYKH